MKTSSAWLHDHARSVYSQYGEDGIIEKILETIGNSNRWCVEFRAWDRKHLSNTFNLIQNHEYSAVLIEGCAQKFRDLLETQKAFPKIVPINAFVGFNATNTLSMRTCLSHELKTEALQRAADLLARKIARQSHAT